MTRTRGLALLVLLLTCVIIIYPEVSFRASLEGLKLWFEIVLPAVLPFFIMADLLMGLGVVHFLGSLLEPIMRPLFRIPGMGGFALAMGLAAGYPLGAKITGDLTRAQQITTTEAERLMSFANTASPLFMMGAVAVGMFGRPELGTTLLMAHYLGAILVGFCMRLHKGPESPPQKRTGTIWTNALRAMDQARKEDGRSFGKLFGDTVRNTFQSMFFIGGCIMIFSVLVHVISATGVLNPLKALLGHVLTFAGLDANLAGAVINGFFETTLGAQTASRSVAPIGAQVTVASLVMGWSGLSVHGQVAAMITDTKIRFTPYLFSRLLHGMFAAILTVLLLGPASFIPTSISKALPAVSTSSYLNGSFGVRFLASARLATSFLLILVSILTVVWLLKRMIYISFRTRS
ncbi:MAG: sporulation integral membrane protein YlbJ [Firmicutes bacterium]|nr:sporulation integral membrane protein YlbJ [Bacillota bacterium]